MLRKMLCVLDCNCLMDLLSYLGGCLVSREKLDKALVFLTSVNIWHLENGSNGDPPRAVGFCCLNLKESAVLLKNNL